MGIFSRKKKDSPETSPKKDVVVEQKKAEVKKAEVKKADSKESVKKSQPKQKEDVKKVFVAQKAKQIIVRPLITEKATKLGAENKHLFEVRPDTNKIEIKKEIERLYKVKPIDVHMINRAGKKVRYGRRTGRTKHVKKAIVTLKPGDHIESKVGA
jgi:large subunit ribosomal protein L23